jgi:hypothetical protein
MRAEVGIGVKIALWSLMPTPDRTVIRRRLALAAVLAVVLLALVIGVRDWLDNDGPETVAAPPPRTINVETPPLPLPEPPLSLAALTAAAADPAPAIAGRRFIVRIPFGCEGIVQDGLTATYEDAERTLRLKAVPQVWTEETVAVAPEGQVDAVEGFWAPAGEDCASGPADRTLGLAVFFEPGGSRVLQRGGRPYEFVGKIADGQAAASPGGYRLLLAGEVSKTEPVRCHKATDGRPVCLIAVVFDQVAFEDPATGESLAEWRMN